MRLVADDAFVIKDRRPNWYVGEATEHTDLTKQHDLVTSFDGVNAVLECIDSIYSSPRRQEQSSGAGNGIFRFFKDFEEAMAVFKFAPWKVRDFEEAEVIINDPDSAGIGTRFDVVGSVLDVGRYLEGDPEPFIEMIDGNPVGHYVTLMINIGALSTVNIAWITRRSQRLQRLVDLLESQQVRVRIEAVRANGISLVEIAIKEYDEPLNLNDLAVCTHPDFLRRMLFRLDEWSETWTPGHGTTEHLDRWLFNHPVLPESSSELSIVVSSWINSLDQVDKEFDDAEKWLVDTLSDSYLSPEERCLHMFKGTNSRPQTPYGIDPAVWSNGPNQNFDPINPTKYSPASSIIDSLLKEPW